MLQAAAQEGHIQTISVPGVGELAVLDGTSVGPQAGVTA